MVITGGGCEEKRELLFNEDRGSVGEDEKILEVNDGDYCTASWIYLMQLNIAVQLKMINLMHNRSESRLCESHRLT